MHGVPGVLMRYHEQAKQFTERLKGRVSSRNSLSASAARGTACAATDAVPVASEEAAGDAGVAPTKAVLPGGFVVYEGSQ